MLGAWRPQRLVPQGGAPGDGARRSVAMVPSPVAEAQSSAFTKSRRRASSPHIALAQGAPGGPALASWPPASARPLRPQWAHGARALWRCPWPPTRRGRCRARRGAPPRSDGPTTGARGRSLWTSSPSLVSAPLPERHRASTAGGHAKPAAQSQLGPPSAQRRPRRRRYRSPPSWPRRCCQATSCSRTKR